MHTIEKFWWQEGTMDVNTDEANLNAGLHQQVQYEDGNERLMGYIQE